MGCSKLHLQDGRQGNLVVFNVQMIMEGKKSLAGLLIFNKSYMIEVSKAGSVSAQLQMPLAHLVSPRSSGNLPIALINSERINSGVLNHVCLVLALWMTRRWNQMSHAKRYELLRTTLKLICGVASRS